MKKYILLLMAVLLFAACFSSTKEKEVEIKIIVDKIAVKSYDESKFAVKEGETLQLNAIVFYSNGVEGHRGIEWKSLDETIATIDANGLVTGIKAGEIVSISASRGEVVSMIELRIKSALTTYQVIGELSDQIDWIEDNFDNMMLSNAEHTIFTKEIVIDNIIEGTSELRKFKFSKDEIIANHFKAVFEGESDFLSGISKIEGTVIESGSTCKINYINGIYRITLNASDEENIIWSIEKIN